MQNTVFRYNDTYAFTEETFNRYLNRLRSGLPEQSDLLSTEYAFFQNQIYGQCYQFTQARTDGVEFMQWLNKSGWQIIICTHRDLRRSQASTINWLRDNDIPFDYLFMAKNKIVFCKLWGIEHLVDDAVFNIVCGGHYGVNVYYPIMAKHQFLPAVSAKGFSRFDEVKQWLES
ncbi:MAG: hypothetical protein M0Z55_04535 [Peptococcaceae bacterium]|nr:hypothetical protein [Peptococcaceae bacterium]